MQVHRLETQITPDRSIRVNGLPFKPGDNVEVIIRSRKRFQKNRDLYPLRGKPFQYIDPFRSVAENAWEAIK